MSWVRPLKSILGRFSGDLGPDFVVRGSLINFGQNFALTYSKTLMHLQHRDFFVLSTKKLHFGEEVTA